MRQSRFTISGAPVVQPETFGGTERRARLMSSAIRSLRGHPVAVAVGAPLGDGLGMEELVAEIKPLFTTEPSLTPWVALRGAVLFLDLLAPNDEGWKSLVSRMGVTYEFDAPSQELIAYVIDPEGRIPFALKGGVTGLVSHIATRWGEYERIEQLSIEQVNKSNFALTNNSIALDYIAWTAAAVLRTGPDAVERLCAIPEPSRLEAPGWYVDPLFAKSERYWDGGDWTARVRHPDSRGADEFLMPLS